MKLIITRLVNPHSIIIIAILLNLTDGASPETRIKRWASNLKESIKNFRLLPGLPSIGDLIPTFLKSSSGNNTTVDVFMRRSSVISEEEEEKTTMTTTTTTTEEALPLLDQVGEFRLLPGLPSLGEIGGNLTEFGQGVGREIVNFHEMMMEQDINQIGRIIGALPTFIPYILDFYAPKLGDFIQGMKVSDEELFRIHQNLIDFHNYLDKQRLKYQEEELKLITDLIDLVQKRNLKLMSLMLKLLIEADGHSEKMVALSEKDVKQIEELIAIPI